MDLYELYNKVKGGYIYMEIQMGMYGLPQSGILVNKLLKERLSEHGYFCRSDIRIHPGPTG